MSQGPRECSPAAGGTGEACHIRAVRTPGRSGVSKQTPAPPSRAGPPNPAGDGVTHPVISGRAASGGTVVPSRAGVNLQTEEELCVCVQ